MTLRVRNVTWWDAQTGDLRTGDLRVDAEPGGQVEPAVGSQAADESVVDGHGGLAMAGLVCAHHHLYSALARGMPEPPRPPRDFAEILELVWWRVDRALDREMVLASALAGAIDAVRCGATAIVDHHASPFALPGALDALAEGLEAVGLAHVLCLELSDRDGAAVAAAGLAESEAWLASGRPGLVGLHASFTVGDGLLDRSVDLARKYGVGLHLHVAEDEIDQRSCLDVHGCRVVERLARAGGLELPGTILAHGLHLNDAERDLVAASEAWLALNPESNQNNAVGAFFGGGLDPTRFLLGTDGMHGDMLRSMQAAFLAGRASGGLAPSDAWRALVNNRRYLETHHPAAARGNDLVILDYRPPTPLASETWLGHALFGLDARQVRTVIAGGRVVLRDGRLTTIDEDETLRFCREQARRLWDALERS